MPSKVIKLALPKTTSPVVPFAVKSPASISPLTVKPANAALPLESRLTNVLAVASIADSPFTFTRIAPLLTFDLSTLATGCALALGGVAVNPPPDATYSSALTEIWSAVDADAADYFARIVTAGSSISSANQAAVNAFIVGCKADGIWSAIKASCLLCAADSLAGALVPLVGTAPTNNGFVSGDYSRTTGLVGNATTKALNSNRNANSDPQNNQSMGVWMTTQRGGYYIGGNGVQSGSTSLNGATGGNNAGRSRSSTVDSYTGNSTGFFGTSRSSSTGYTVRFGGTSTAKTRTSSTVSSGSILVFRISEPNTFTDARMTFYWIGESLDLALLDARLTTLMAAIT